MSLFFTCPINLKTPKTCCLPGQSRRPSCTIEPSPEPKKPLQHLRCAPRSRRRPFSAVGSTGKELDEGEFIVVRRVSLASLPEELRSLALKGVMPITGDVVGDGPARCGRARR